jgi:fibronectin-binding autotransporter adhesin
MQLSTFLTPLKRFRKILTITLTLLVSSLQAVDYTSVATGQWSTAATWSPAGVPTTGDNVTIASGHTITLTANVDLGSGTLSHSGTIALAGRSLSAGSLSGSGAIGTSSGSPVLTVGSNNNSTTHSGVISNGIVLTKQGSGIFTLSGANTYTGATTVSAGTLQIAAAERISNSSALTVSSGATFDLNGFTETVASIAGAGTITSGAAGTCSIVHSGSATTTFSGVIQNGSGTVGLTKQSTGILTLTGANTNTGTITLSGGTLSVGAGSTSGSIVANVTNTAAATLRFDRSDAYTYSGVISGTIAVTKLGAGTLTFDGNNTSTGITTISAGTLSLGAGGTTGSVAGNITNNAALIIDRSNTYIYAGVISGSGSVTKQGAGTLTYSGANSYTGATNVSVGTLQISAAERIGNSSALVLSSGTTFNLNGFTETVGSLAGSGTVSSSAAGTITFSCGGNNSSTSFTGTLQNGSATVLNFTKAGTGTLTLSGTITHSGTTIISAGTLSLAASEVIPNATVMTITGTLDLNGNSETVGSITGAGTVTSSSAGTSILSCGGLNTSTTFSGVFQNGSGSVGLTKLGSGTLTLTGANTNTGTTTISAGTLSIGSGATTGELTSTSVVNNAILTFNRSNDLSCSSNITGNGRINKSGAGALTLSGNSSYTGMTTINASGGTIVANNANALGASFAVILNASATLRTDVGLTYSGALIASGTGSKINCNGQNSTCGVLYLGGNAVREGTYGSSASSAPLANQNDTYFTVAAGTVTSSASGRTFFVNDASQAGDIYTSAIGNNANPGTNSAPFATLTYALSQAGGRDIIYVDAGVYGENVSITKSISLRGANYGIPANSPSNRATLNPARYTESQVGAASGTVFTISAGVSNVYIDGFRITGNVGGFDLSAGALVMDSIMIANNYLQSLGGTGITDNGSAGSVLSNVLIYANRFDGNTGANQTAIRIYSAPLKYNIVAAENYVNGSYPTNTTSRGIQISAKVTNGFIINNTVENIAIWALYSANGQNGFTCSGNTVSNIGQSGFQFQGFDNSFGSNNMTVTGNTFNNVRGRAIYHWGWYNDPFTNVTISNNTVNLDVSLVSTTSTTAIDIQGSEAVPVGSLNSGPITVSGNTVNLTGTAPGTLKAVNGLRIGGSVGNISVTNNELEGLGEGDASTFPGAAIAIRTNFCYTCAYTGLGTYYSPISGRLTATGNKINGGRGFMVYDAVSNTYTGLDSAFTAVLEENDLSGATTHAVYMVGGDSTLQANCNWWGTSDSSVFSSKVVGTADFNPWLLSGIDASPAIGFTPSPDVCFGGIGFAISGPDTVCPTIINSYTLEGVSSGFGSYNWTVTPSSGVTISGSTASRNIRINASGTYVLQVVNTANGFTRSKTIFVSGIPANPTVSGPSVVCAGGTEIYTAAASGASSFSWRSTTGATFSPNDVSNPVTVSVGLITGTQNIRVRAINQYGCLSGAERSVNISVVTSPSGGSISGTTTPCVSATASQTYTVSGVSGSISAYNWSVNNFAVITGSGSSVQIRFTQPGATTIRCVPVNSSCSGDTIVLNVTANDCGAALAVSGPTKACSGVSVGYKASAAGSYTWSLSPVASGTIVSGQGSDSITVVYNADYAVSVTNVTVQASPASGTPATRATAVNNTPATPVLTPSPTSACTGASVSCSATSTGALTYSWNVLYAASSTPSSTSTFGFVMGSRSASVTVKGNANGCLSATTRVTVTRLSCKFGEDELSEAAPSISIYPNPAQDLVSLELNGREESVVSNIEIRDVTGAVVTRMENLQLYLQQPSMLNTSSLAPGLYQVSMTVNGEILPAVRLMIAR